MNLRKNQLLRTAMGGRSTTARCLVLRAQHRLSPCLTQRCPGKWSVGFRSSARLGGELQDCGSFRNWWILDEWGKLSLAVVRADLFPSASPCLLHGYREHPAYVWLIAKLQGYLQCYGPVCHLLNAQTLYAIEVAPSCFLVPRFRSVHLKPPWIVLRFL